MRFARLLLHCAIISFCLLQPNAAWAEDPLPPGTMKIIAPFSPGGAADVIARAIGSRLSRLYDRPVVVENRPGVGGNIGAEAVAKAKPDGLTLLLGTVGIHAAYSVYRRMSYSPSTDLQPVIILGEVPCVIAVHPSRPIHSLDEFLKYAKANPEKLTFGSAGNGSSTHMVGELFEQAAGIKLSHVPYRGSSAAMNDLMGGQIDMMFELITTAAPIVQSGRIRPLAVTSKIRSPALPSVPTVSELAIPGFEGTGWFTVATAAGAPKDVVNRLNRDINAILKAPELQETWKGLALSIIGGTPEEAKSFFASETIKWSKVIKAADIHAD
jgi:tripartite-type tricarboxylate transporter receptor subunit TctC